jgi:hypothetical protein
MYITSRDNHDLHDLFMVLSTMNSGKRAVKRR